MATNLAHQYDALVLRATDGYSAGNIEVLLHTWLKEYTWIARAISYREVPATRVPDKCILRTMVADAKPSKGTIPIDTGRSSGRPSLLEFKTKVVKSQVQEKTQEWVDKDKVLKLQWLTAQT